MGRRWSVNSSTVERVAGGRALPDPHDRALAGEEHLSHAESLAGAQQRLPPSPVGGRRFEQQDLRRSSRVTPEPQTRRDDPGLVQHEEVAVAQEFRQVADVTMFGRCRATVDEQAGAVARLDRRLGDAIVGQVVVEVGDLHRPEATAANLVRSGPDPKRTERISRTGWRCRTRRGTATPMCSYAASSATRPARRAGDHPLGDEERLVHVLDRLGLLADADRHGRQADRAAVELDAQRVEDRPVDLVEAAIVDAEQRQPTPGHLGVDRSRRRGPRRSRARAAAAGWRCAACLATGGRSPTRRQRRSRRRGSPPPVPRSPAVRSSRSSRGAPRGRTGRAGGP